VGVLFDYTGTPGQSYLGDEGFRATLQNYRLAPEDDPFGHATNAVTMLVNFVDPQGPYAGAWWFEADGRADIYEALAVILYTEGHTNVEVRKAVAARYLWFCAGTGTTCSGSALVSFLAYFQPWREPWMVPGGITQEHARVYLDFARELVHQQPGLLTEWIPGADVYAHTPEALSTAGSIAWDVTPFHFANVHPTWDSYLRTELARPPNGPARLWVLTMGEAERVCRTRFVCQDMTRPRSG
jgi:hypothetical protein